VGPGNRHGENSANPGVFWSVLAASEQLSLDVRADGADGPVVIAVAGEVDLATAPQLDACLSAYTDRDVTVDLSDVTFLDSSGLSTLVSARRALLDRGHVLRTTGEQDHVRTVLEIAGLLRPLHGED
jgi:anti-sigma B factor antagonist